VVCAFVPSVNPNAAHEVPFIAAALNAFMERTLEMPPDLLINNSKM